MPIKKNVKMLVADAKNQTNSISAAEAYKMQQAGTAKLIDIRDIRECNEKVVLMVPFMHRAAC